MHPSFTTATASRTSRAAQISEVRPATRLSESRVAVICDLCGADNYATVTRLRRSGWYYGREALCPDCHAAI